MALVVEGTPVEFLDAGDADNHDVTLPTGITANEFLVIAWVSTENKTWSATGYTEIKVAGQGSSTALGFLYKIASGSEGATVNVSTTGNSGFHSVACRISGIDTVDPTHSDNNIAGNVGSSQTSYNIAAAFITGLISGNGLLVSSIAEASRNVTTLDADLVEVEDVVSSPSVNLAFDAIISATSNPQYDYTWSGSRDYDYIVLEIAVASAAVALVGENIIRSFAVTRASNY